LATGRDRYRRTCGTVTSRLFPGRYPGVNPTDHAQEACGSSKL
jgi:hypothetical protein